MTAIRVILGDDHVLVRAGVRALLQKISDVEVVGEASNGREILELAHQHQPDLVLTDIAMPGLNGLETVSRLKKDLAHLKVIMLSMHTNEEYVRWALESGASGYLVKGADPAELELAIKAVMRGEVYLSPAISKNVVNHFLQKNREPPSPSKELTGRQREILQLLAEGHSTKNIAQELHLSVKTVETHRMDIMNRLNIHDLPGLVRYAIRTGLTSSEE